MPDRIRLDGRVAVVTGAAGVIGTATIRLLAERGARIVAVDRREDDLKTAIKDLPASARRSRSRPTSRARTRSPNMSAPPSTNSAPSTSFYNNAGIEGDIKPITRIFAGSVSPRARRQRGRRLPRHEACAAGDAEAEQGQHHQHRLDRRPDRLARYRGLQRQQARGDRADQERRLGMHRHRRARQLRLPRPDRQPDAERDHRRAAIPATRRSPTTRSSTGFRRAGSDRPPRSPPSWRSSPPTRQAMSRAPPTPSTAARTAA